jgi:caffeoyl-CoA O-methyltransferase
MQDKFTTLDADLYRYLVAHSSPADTLERELIETTAGLGSVAMMQVAREQAAFLGMLTKIAGARYAVEVGTFTGYSALAVARALPDDGRLICCDINEQWTAIALEFWERAGVSHKITLEIAPAIETLRALPLDRPIDIAFIDADKTGYSAYYEEILRRMRRGGLIVVDNVLWMGTVLNPDATDPETVAIRKFNDCVVTDPRVEAVMLPISDGLTLIRKN